MASGTAEAEKDPRPVALTNRLILQSIFSNLTSSELKNCRLVSKTWNFEAGSYMKDFRQCHVSIAGVNLCSDLYELDQLVSGMDVVPINSLSVDFGTFTHSACQAVLDESKIYSERLGKMSLKYLKIGESSCFGREDQCPGFPFVVSLIHEKQKELRTLEVNFFGHALLERLFRDWTPMLPKLTTLDVGMSWILRKDLFLKLINGAPNLKKLKGYFLTSELKSIPQDKYGLLDSFDLHVYSDEEAENCCRLVEARPALSQLSSGAPYEHQNRRGFFKIFEELMETSRMTLETVHMHDLVFPLTRPQFRPMVSLNTLKISTGGELQQVLDVLQGTDYSERLPALAEVEINQYSDYNEQELEQLEDAMEEIQVPAQPHSSARVTKLSLSTDVQESVFQELSFVFPNVSELVVRQPCMMDRTEILYHSLWAHWPLLESIYVTEEITGGNFDADFLGIYPQEAEILREEADESLEKMNIVPVRPCVLTMSRLKLLKIRFYKRPEFRQPCPFTYSDKTFLSKVTGILALRKLTKMGIRVQLVSEHPEIVSGLTHLVPFVSVVLDDGEDCRKRE